MRVVAVSLLTAWAIINVILAVVARAKPLVAAVFAGSALVLGAGLALAHPAVADVGLAGSLAAPALYGALVLGRNQLSHHIIRAMVVVGLAVLYWLT